MLSYRFVYEPILSYTNLSKFESCASYLANVLYHLWGILRIHCPGYSGISLKIEYVL